MQVLISFLDHLLRLHSFHSPSIEGCIPDHQSNTIVQCYRIMSDGITSSKCSICDISYTAERSSTLILKLKVIWYSVRYKQIESSLSSVTLAILSHLVKISGTQ